MIIRQEDEDEDDHECKERQNKAAGCSHDTDLSQIFSQNK
jgi:hypothetical protein